MQQREHVQAVHFMNWVRGAQIKWPQLKWLHHIPNGGQRSKAVAGKLKAEGVKAGVSDYNLPWPCTVIGYLCPCGHLFGYALGQYGCPNCCGDSGMAALHEKRWAGLFLEFKPDEGGRLTDKQIEFLTDMAAAGYAVAVAHGQSQAVDIVTAYLEGQWWENETEFI